MIIQKYKNTKGLPKETQSLCPECKKLISAKIYSENVKVMIEKTCNSHGMFKDVYWSDIGMYLHAEKYAYDGIGVSNPKIKDANTCPFDCGLCNLHLSHTVLANIDLTNRCNLKCQICFANAAASGYVYEPSYEQVVQMLNVLRAKKPVPTPAVQFSGGEPTIYPKIFEVLKYAKQVGFAQVQIATNGLKLTDMEFCIKLRNSGLNTTYLQFDGFNREMYKKIRGRDLLNIKFKVIENYKNIKPTPMSLVLVPTIVNEINNHEVGKIVDFGIKNSDTIRCVNFQPVSFTGRIEQKMRIEQRYTLPDLVNDLCSQLPFLQKNDFYTVPCVAPISELISIISNESQVAFTAHPHCGLATFILITRDNVIPIPRFIDVKGMFKKMLKIAEKAEKYSFFIKLYSKIVKKDKTTKKKMFEKYFSEFVNKKEIPGDFDVVDILSDLFSDHTKSQLGKFTWKTMMIGGMHFQDDYNYDIERVKRCVIHYATPDGRIIPFCAYNGGPCYRNDIEKKYSIPLSEYHES